MADPLTGRSALVVTEGVVAGRALGGARLAIVVVGAADPVRVAQLGPVDAGPLAAHSQLGSARLEQTDDQAAGRLGCICNGRRDKKIMTRFDSENGKESTQQARVSID